MKKKVEQEKGVWYLKSLGPRLFCCSKFSAGTSVSALPTCQSILLLAKPATYQRLSFYPIRTHISQERYQNKRAFNVQPKCKF